MKHDYLNRTFLLASLMLCLHLTVTCQKKNIQAFKSVDAVEFFIKMQQHDNSVLIDVRTKREYKKERIDNSILAKKKKILLSIADTLDHEQPVFVYCDVGTRSFTACIILTDMGFKNVYNLERGLIEWKEAGYPVVER